MTMKSFPGNNAGVRATFLILMAALAAFAPSAAHGQSKPLAAESIVNDVDFFPMEAISPSPDGKWIAYLTADPTKPMRFDYVGQRFAKSGYPMLAGAQAMSVWVTELATGNAIQMTQTQGSSWMPSWSPDSRYLAFYSDRTGTATVWVWDRQTKTSREISPAQTHTAWWHERPDWSADGKSVVVPLLPEGMTLEDVLKMSPMGTGEKSPAPTDLKATSVHVYAFHPAEQAEKMKAASAAASGGAASSDEIEGTDYMNGIYYSDMASIDVASGRVTRLTKKIRPMSFALSPDRMKLGILTAEGSTPHTQQLVYTLRIYDFHDQTTKDVAKGFMEPNNLTTRFTWSPDSTRIAYSDTGLTAERAAYVVDVKSGARTKVSVKLPASSMDFTWGPPLWDRASKLVYLTDTVHGTIWEVSADGETARSVVKPGVPVKDVAYSEAASSYWSPDGGATMYIRSHDSVTKKDSIYSVNVASGETAKIYESDDAMGMRQMGSLVGVPLDSGTLIFPSESATHPQEAFALSLRSKQTTQVSRLNPQYSSVDLGKTKIIDWISLQGEQLHGTLLMPADYDAGKRYPLVVFIYGGDVGSDKANRFAFGWGSAFNPQMYATRGYAVLYPDIPLHPGTPIADLVSAVIPGVNKTVELGIVDPSRMAVMGQSFGGYNTIGLITQTSIFKAAVATSPATVDLWSGYTGFYNGMPAAAGYYEEGQGGMKGNPWQFKQRYYDNSPLFFLDQVKTPLLLERGVEDQISTYSENVYIALQVLGKDVELLEYDHEDHVLQQPVNVIDFWKRRLDWLDRYLSPAKTPN
jgi:dipeptidyl aminopeptidase/acylaminoacyl peptidase